MSVALESRNDEVFSFLTFAVGGSSYALPITDIWEILEYRKVSAVPGSSPMVHGVFNYSGTIVPVVDLCAKFGDGRVEVSKSSCIIVVNAHHSEESLRVGLLVDAVRDVVDVGPDAIEPAPAFGSRVRLEYLKGLLRTDSGLTIVLAADRFLSASELMEVSAVVSEEQKKSSKRSS